jgi:FAD/FMN-containing dehydrogenase
MTRDLANVDVAKLDKLLGDRLLRVEAPLRACVTDPGSTAPERSAADVAAAVEFARDRGIGLVIKGTGHDYLGRSSAPESLLI